MGEYYEASGIYGVRRGMQIDEGEVFVPRVRVFGMEEAQEAQAQGFNVYCFRIPAVVQTVGCAILSKVLEKKNHPLPLPPAAFSFDYLTIMKKIIKKIIKQFKI